MKPTRFARMRHRTEFKTGPFLVTEAGYAPRAAYDSHFHVRPCVSVVLEGLVVKHFGSERLELAPSRAVAMPPREPHLAHMGDDGARVLMIEPEDTSETLLATARSVFDRVTPLHDVRLQAIAWRLCEEIAAPDDVTPLAVDGLVREFIAAAVRCSPRAGRGAAPKWVRSTQDLLRDGLTEPWSVASLAREAGVHPAHLARTFRLHCGMSLGAYARRLRVEWAALKLRTTANALCDIAAEAGFSDQSHFTRVFQRHMGVSPGRYRASIGRTRRTTATPSP